MAVVHSYICQRSLMCCACILLLLVGHQEEHLVCKNFALAISEAFLGRVPALSTVTIENMPRHRIIYDHDELVYNAVRKNCA